VATPYIHPTRGPLHLGRPRVSPRNTKTMAKAFRLHDFLATLPTPPDALDLTGGITSWGEMYNDSLGDCTCAATGHMIQSWTATNGSEITVPDSAILTEYEQACGYNPSDPSTDQGGIITTVLDYFRDSGVGGYKIQAHAEVNLTQLRVSQAMTVFGALDGGVQLPVSAQNQVGSVWDFVNDTPDEPGGWGGHSIAIVKYDASGVWCVTWGALQQMTWRWFMYYFDELDACISTLWKPPVDVSQLVGDLQQVGT
jgi:hypothetical protein